MRVAVTGAGGFIGSRLVEHLHRRGHQVYAFGRRPAEQLARSLPVEYRAWDITRGPLQRPPEVDAVVHCAARVDDWGSAHAFFAANVLGTRSVLAGLPAARFIHLSSASVYDPRASAAAHREDEPLPARYRDQYSRTKLLSERLVLGSGRAAVVLRPHAVYGPGDTTLLPRLLRARRFGRLFAPGNGRNLLSLTHVDNLAHAVEQALERRRPSGVFNVADPEPERVDALLRCLLQALGVRPAVMYIPAPVAGAVAMALEGLCRVAPTQTSPLLTRYAVAQMTGNGVLDTGKARRLLDYRPRRTYREAFAELGAAQALHLSARLPARPRYPAG